MNGGVTELELKALRAVEACAAEQVSFVQDLVACPSLPGDEGPCQERIAHELRDLDLEVSVLECRHDALSHHPAFCDDGFDPIGRMDVIGRLVGEGGGEGVGTLVLNGHVDVVPTGELALWTGSPWSGDVRDGRIWGRGSCDMKGGLSAAIYAVRALRNAGITLDRDLLIHSVIGEETGGLGTLTAIEEGYLADAAVILEPTSLQLCPVQSGALTFRLEVQGRSTHAAAKNEGVSAIDKLRLLLTAVDRLEVARHQAAHQPLYDDPSHVAPVNVGTVNGGDWHSTVPGSVAVEGRYGVFPGETVPEARAALVAALDQASQGDPWLRSHPPRLTWFEGQFESGETPVDHPLVSTLQRIHAEVMGSPAELRGVTYGSDLRLFTNHAKMPAVLYGPGDLREAHSIDESVSIDDVLNATRAMVLMVIRWCGGREK